MVLEDIAWLDFDRIRKETLAVSQVTESLNPDVRAGMRRRRHADQPGFPE
jgi:mediator of RNA polymerase II transcription subunit 14